MLPKGLSGSTGMRNMGMATRSELLEALRQRYGAIGRGGKSRILDEFVAVTGYHRKHAVRLFRGGDGGCSAERRGRPPRYGDAVRDALILVWEASDRICGKRLHALLPDLVPSMERHGHRDLGEEVRASLLSMSATTIDRQLCEVRAAAGVRRRRRSSTLSAVRRQIPVTASRPQGRAPSSGDSSTQAPISRLPPPKSS